MTTMTAMPALLWFTVWTLLLMFVYVGYRVLLVVSFKKQANAWTRGQPTEDPGFITRAHHAHLNCVENLPVFAAIVLAAYAMGRPEAVDPFAQYVLWFRLAQSTVHLISIAPAMVFIRANLFIAQLLLFLWMIKGLLF